MRIHKNLSLLTAVILMMNTLGAPIKTLADDNGDGTQTVTSRRDASMDLTGKIGEFDPETTDPDQPGVTAPGDDGWIKVVMPTTVVYWSTGASQHKLITSNEQSITNKSNYPVKVELTGYYKDGTTPTPDTTGLDVLTMEGSDLSSPISLVTNGAATIIDDSTNLVEMFDLGPGGTSPAPGSFNGSNVGKFKISGKTDTGYDLSKQLQLDNQLQFTLVPLDGDGQVVKDPNIPVVNPDGSIDFANEKWDDIKDLGNGNHLVAMQESIGQSVFAARDTFFLSNSDTDNGYDSSLPSSNTFDWYNKKIKGTSYENFVVPVTPTNVTMGDMKELGWTSYTDGNSISAFLAVNQPNAFPTAVDETNGVKQAFEMSGSDVSNGQGPVGDLTSAALKHRDNLKANGILSSWLRTPGISFTTAAAMNSEESYVISGYVDNMHDVVPSLVIHIP